MKTKILLVEDYPDLGMVLKQYLEFSDFEVNWIPNPELILSNKQIIQDYQLAILDVMLPFMDGFELSKEIKKYQKFRFFFSLRRAKASIKSLD